MKEGKGGPLSTTDLKFLGYSEVKKQTPSDFALPGRCRVFAATTPAGISSAQHWFIYLLADCTNDDLVKVERSLKSGLFEGEEYHIVVPKSLFSRKALQPLKGPDRSVHVFEDLMWSKIHQEFGGYMQGLRKQLDDLKAGISYVEPSLLTEEENELLEPPTDYFVDFFSEPESSGVTVIIGEAGVGKTTLAVMVADKLVQQWEKLHVIPVLLTEQMIVAQQQDGANNSWDVLHQVLHQEGNDFPLSDEMFFTHLMRQGYIAFIFDGFDELREMSLSPRENFAWLNDIADDSSARLMVTTRTSFWRREIEMPQTTRKLLNLKHFSKDDAYEYFNKCLGRQEEVLIKAKQIYNQLHKDVEKTGESNFHFVDLPACAAMIVDYVKKGGNIPKFRTENKNIIDAFFSDILDRERERQKIATGLKEIRDVFEDVAISYDEFPMDALEAAGLQHEDLDSVRDHAFLIDVSSGQTSKYRFKHEFLLYYLRASRILAMLERGGEEFVDECKSNLFILLCNEADGKGHLGDQIANFVSENNLQNIVKAYQICSNHKLKSFFFHIIAKRVALRSPSPGKSRDERAEEIFNLLGAQDKKITGLSIEGAIVDLSLRNWVIRDSHFVNLALIKCETDNLIFSKCHFVGNLELSKAEFKDCTGEGDAELIISVANGVGDISEEDIRECLKTVLRRFRPRNHFRTIGYSEWKTGKTKSIEERFDLLESMKRENLVKKIEHHPRLEIEKSRIGEVRDFIDNGKLTGSVKTVFDHMEKKIHPN